MSNTISAKYLDFASILNNPSGTVPTLSDSQTDNIIIDSIKAYIEKDIDFVTFVDLTHKINFFSGMRESAINETSGVLNKLSALSMYVNNEDGGRNNINLILLEVLNDLSKKQ